MFVAILVPEDPLGKLVSSCEVAILFPSGMGLQVVGQFCLPMRNSSIANFDWLLLVLYSIPVTEQGSANLSNLNVP